MKKTYRFASILALAGFAIGALAQGEFVPGEVLVKFRPGYELASRAARVAIGAELESTNRSIGVERISLPPGMSASQGLQYFRSNPYVQFAELNGIYRAHFIPNDPKFAQQYQHLRVQTPAAWDLNQGSANVIIAILDTGVDKAHVDLSAKIVGGFDFVNNDPDAQDDNGHGTHVAGLAAAMTNNGVGVAGTGFNCKIMPVKVLSAGGGGSFDGVANGITFAADNGAKVINMSLGGPSPSATLEAAVNYAWNKGVVIVASAGNNGDTNPNYPGFYDKCIAVASTDINDLKSGFSTYGPWVDVAAPGDNVLNTLLGGTYGNESGTSMASPVTAGVVGLIVSHSPAGTTNTQIRATLEDNCDFVGTFVVKGRINAFKALNAIGTFVDVTVAATAVNPNTGNYGGGNLTSVQTLDNAKYSMVSVPVSRQGSVAAASVDFQTDENLGTANKAWYRLNGSALKGVTGMLYLYNWSTSTFVHVKSFPMTNVSSSTIDVELPKPYSQWANSGTLRILYRGVAPERSRISYTLGLDRAQLIVKKRVF